MINTKKIGGNGAATYRPSAALMVASTYQAWVDGVYQPKRPIPVAVKPCRLHRQPAHAYM